MRVLPAGACCPPLRRPHPTRANPAALPIQAHCRPAADPARCCRPRPLPVLPRQPRGNQAAWETKPRDRRTSWIALCAWKGGKERKPRGMISERVSTQGSMSRIGQGGRARPTKPQKRLGFTRDTRWDHQRVIVAASTPWGGRGLSSTSQAVVAVLSSASTRRRAAGVCVRFRPPLRSLLMGLTPRGCQ